MSALERWSRRTYVARERSKRQITLESRTHPVVVFDVLAYCPGGSRETLPYKLMANGLFRRVHPSINL